MIVDISAILEAVCPLVIVFFLMYIPLARHFHMKGKTKEQAFQEGFLQGSKKGEG